MQCPWFATLKKHEAPTFVLYSTCSEPLGNQGECSQRFLCRRHIGRFLLCISPGVECRLLLCLYTENPEYFLQREVAEWSETLGASER